MALCHYLSKITAADINICIKKQLHDIKRKLYPSLILYTANQDHSLAQFHWHFLSIQSEVWLLIRSDEY